MALLSRGIVPIGLADRGIRATGWQAYLEGLAVLSRNIGRTRFAMLATAAALSRRTKIILNMRRHRTNHRFSTADSPGIRAERR